MGEKIKNKIVVLEPSTKSTKELLQHIKEKDIAEVEVVSSPEEAIQVISASLPCMFIASIIDNNAVPSRVQLFKRLETAIKQHGLKIFTVSPLKNRQLSDLVTQKMGVADFIMEPVPVRTMIFKANLQLKAVDNFRRQQEMKRLAEEKVVIKKLENGKKPDAGVPNELKPGQRPALEMADDTFLFKNSGVKKAGKKFTVEMEGPDPSTGEWVPHEDKGNEQSSWRWVPNEEKEEQASGKAKPDGWVHQGDKPVFNEASQKWAMTSEDPSLALLEDGKKVAEKVGVDEKGDLFVAEDSPAAEENLKKNRLKALEKKKEKDLAKQAAGGEKSGAEGKGDGKADALKKLEVEPDAKDPKAPGKLAVEADGKDPTFSNRSGAALDQGNSAGELKDRRDPGNQEKVRPLQEKRSTSEEAGKGESSLKDLALDREDEEAGANGIKPLAKEKDQKDRKAEKLKSAFDALKEESAEPGELEKDESDAPTARPRKLKKESDDPLARLQSKLGETESEEEETAEAFPEIEKEADEEEQASLGRPKLKTAKDEKSALDKLAALREDPAEKRGELRDLQGPPKIAALKALKKKSLADIQAMLEQPLPEELAKEEEEALREELGLKGRPEIKPKELAKKKRLKDIKALKDELSRLDQDLRQAEEEEKGDVISAPISKDDSPEHRQGDLRADKLKGIGRALDSEEIAEEEKEKDRLKKERDDEPKKRKGSDVLDAFHYVPAGEILPLGNAWEGADGHYAYLSSEIRYRGFSKLEELLPLWWVQADDVPKLLDKTNQWRFRGGKPVQAKTLGEVPKEVRDFLISIRDAIRSGKNPGAEKEAKKDFEESAEDEGERRGKRSEDSDDDLSLTAEERKEREEKRLNLDSEESADRILAQLGGDEESQDERELSTGADEEASEERGSSSRTDREEESGDELRAGGKKTNDEAGADDPLARLRAKLGDDSEEETSASRDREDSKSEDSNAQAGAESGRPDQGSVSATEEALAKETKSESIQKFLEKRKKKQAEPLPELKEPLGAINPAAALSNGKTVYLGVLIALSDATSPDVDPNKALERVVNSLELAFGGCFAACTTIPDANGMASVTHGSPAAPAKGEKVSLSDGTQFPISTTSGGEEKILGYLFIKAGADRENFGTREENTAKQAASRLWPLLQAITKTENKAA